MLTEILKIIDAVSKEERDTLMSTYLSHIESRNPFKRVKQTNYYNIALDIIKIKDIIDRYDENLVLDIIFNEKYRTNYIRDKIRKIQNNNFGIIGIKHLVRSEEKNIEAAFF